MSYRTLATLFLASLATGCLSAPPLESPGGYTAAAHKPSAVNSRAATEVPRNNGSALAPSTQRASSPVQAPSKTPVLYARDGTPVQGGGGTTVQSPSGHPNAPLAARELAGNQGGRMYILELYQNVIEERDKLSIEVEALGGELDRTRQALAAADQRISGLEQDLSMAAEENQRMRTENVDLAGRLTTAQIRRLQTEKILLELRLAEIDAAATASLQNGTKQP